MTAAVVRTGDGQRVHAAGACYSLRCACGPSDSNQRVEHLRAYAYVRAELLVCSSEVNRTEERLGAFAKTSGLELAATFVEDDPRRPLLAFQRFFQAVMRDKVPVVLLPSLLHLMVLGAPGRIKEYFEAATQARVVTLDHTAACHVGEAVS